MAPSKTKKSKGKPTATKASANPKSAKAPEAKKVAGKPAPTKTLGKKAEGKKAASPKKAAAPAPKGKTPAPKGKTPAPRGKKGASDKTEKRNAKLRAIKEAAARAADDAEGDEAKRNFGLRGAAPWVARHAAKHAEEIRKRNAEPPPPGSARATLRTPKEAEEIKGKISLLHQRISTINTLRKKLDKSFFEIGELLGVIQSEHLFEAKGYATFESFLDREIELPRISALKLVRIVHTFEREAALDYPLDRLMNAISALDGELLAPQSSQATTSSRTLPGSSRGYGSTTLPPKPPIRWD